MPRLADGPHVGDAHRPQQPAAQPLGARDDAVLVVDAAPAVPRHRQRPQHVVRHQLVRRVVEDGRPPGFPRSRNAHQLVGTAADMQRQRTGPGLAHPVLDGHVDGGIDPFNQTVHVRTRLRIRHQPARGEEHCKAAAGLDGVVDQRCAVLVQRHPPHQAVQPPALHVAAAFHRPLAEPDGVDQLRQHRLAKARERQLPIDCRHVGVHIQPETLARVTHQARQINPLQAADAVGVVDRGHLEGWRKGLKERITLCRQELRDAQRIALHRLHHLRRRAPGISA